MFLTQISCQGFSTETGALNGNMGIMSLDDKKNILCLIHQLFNHTKLTFTVTARIYFRDFSQLAVCMNDYISFVKAPLFLSCRGIIDFDFEK